MSSVGPNNGPGRGRVVVADMSVVIPASLMEKVQRPPQKKIDEFWKTFTTKAPGKATTILPKNELAERLAKRSAVKDLAGGSSKATTSSYEEAAALCRTKVDQIVTECRRINQKYRDPHFDLDYDLRSNSRDCLESLSGNAADYSSDSDSSSTSSSPSRSRRGSQRQDSRQLPARAHRSRRGDRNEGDVDTTGKTSPKDRNKTRGQWPGSQFRPASVKRVGDIFDDPKFYIDGPTANDVRQGRDGDCWLMAALCTLSNKPGLIERACVAHNQDVGVYGFVFHRDGEWFSEIIDDKLYLIKPDYDQAWAGRNANFERILWEDIDRPDAEETYRRAYQSNSVALYFAQCENPNETWLPLLEKAYAKAHGDYSCIEGGYTGEGIEDLTGGVTTELFTTDVLDKEYFWKEELMKVNQDFLFGCSTGLWGLGYGDRKGIYEGHAYSIMRAVEIDDQRLLLLKNPWGKGEWKGPWSDGSKEWTPEWLKKLDHRFGDDGAFWISYKDLLRKYQTFERTRLFSPEWKITSMWTTLNVAWSVEYHHTKFSFTLAKPGPVVIVLSQLDDRYFSGLEGPYWFGLGFRVHKAGEEDYLVRTQTAFRMNRSCNVELELEAGEYTVLIKLDAGRYDKLPAEEVVRRNAKNRREKLLRIGLAYDLAHSKARIVETAEEKAAREAYEKRSKDKHRRLVHKLCMESRQKRHYFRCKEIKGQEKERVKEKEAQKKQAEKREARRKAKEEKATRREEPEQANEATTDPAQKPEHKSTGGDSSPNTADRILQVADEKQEAEAKEARPTETSTDQTDGSAAESKDGENQVKAEAPEPEGSIDAGKNTPSASTSDAPTVEPVDTERQPAVVEKADGDKDNAPSAEAVSAPATEDASNTPAVEPVDADQQSAVVETVGGDENKDPSTEIVSAPAKEDILDATIKPGGPQIPIVAVQNGSQSSSGTVSSSEAESDSEAASNADRRNNSSSQSAEIKEKIRKAIGVISDFKNELEGLLGESRNGDSELDPDDSYSRHYHNHHHHPQHPQHLHPQHLHPQHLHPQHLHPQHPHHPQRPRPLHSASSHSGPPRAAPPPPSDGGQQSDDDEDDVLSLPCLSDISDTELDYLVQHNDNEAARIPQSRLVESDSDEVESDPWNAVAVVGLRIYYKVAEEDKDAEGLVKLRVVRPNQYDFSDDEGDGDDEKEEDQVKKEEVDESNVLDVDDSAKDATVKGVVKGEWV